MKQGKNILFFSSYFFPYISGLTVYPFRILAHYAERHNVTVLTFPHNHKLKKHETVNNIKIVRMPYLFKLSKGYISPQSFFYFLSYIKKADVVILNLPNAEALPLAIMGKLLGKEIISLFHCRVYLGKDILSRFICSLLDFFVYIQLLLSNTVVAYPEYVKEMPFYNSVSKKLKPCYPPVYKLPIDKSYFQKLLSRKGDEKWIGFAGRIAREKGLEYLISAYEKQQTKKPKRRLVFAGPAPKEVAGENDYAKKILSILDKKHIPYTFLGTLTEDKLGAFYEAIDVFVLPSVNSTEAFGMVQIEAMKIGTPVIASDMPGVRVPVGLTGMGLVIDVHNPGKFADALSRVLEDKKAFASESLAKKAEKIFSLDRVLQIWDDMI